MPQIVKIAQIEKTSGEKDGKGWTRYVITGEDKVTASTFDNQASSLKAGDVIEAEIELKGKFVNLKSFKALEKALAPEETKKTAPLPSRDSRGDSIERQVAVKAVVELVVAKIIPDKHPLFGMVLDWCWEKLSPGSTRPPFTSSKQQPEGIEEESGVAGQVEPTKPLKQRDISAIKTITDMYKACHSDFGLQPKQVMAELNIGNWSELTLPPKEAYEQIASVRQ